MKKNKLFTDGCGTDLANVGSKECNTKPVYHSRKVRLIPVLFSTPMVTAICDGRKTKTRRLVKGIAADWLGKEFGFLPEFVADPGNASICPYGQFGDMIWVKELHYRFGHWKKNGITKTGKQRWKFMPDKTFTETRYFDNPPKKIQKGTRCLGWYKRSSLFMPFKCSRIFLQVQSIKIERLNDITEADAKAEGVDSCEMDVLGTRYKHYTADASGHGDPSVDFPTVGSAVNSFETLWQKINGPDSWEENPWVWVVEFAKIDITTFAPTLSELQKSGLKIIK